MISGNPAESLLVTLDLFRSLYSVAALIFEALFCDVFIRLVYLHVDRLVTEVLSYDNHRWAQIANPLINVANIFISGLAVPLTFKNVNGLVIEANFFSQSANPPDKNSCNCGFNKV